MAWLPVNRLLKSPGLSAPSSPFLVGLNESFDRAIIGFSHIVGKEHAVDSPNRQWYLIIHEGVVASRKGGLAQCEPRQNAKGKTLVAHNANYDRFSSRVPNELRCAPVLLDRLLGEPEYLLLALLGTPLVWLLPSISFLSISLFPWAFAP